MVNLILDLDETLIHTIVSEDVRPDLEKRADFSFRFSPQSSYYYVFKRPGLKQFMDRVFKNFNKVGIWTAADRIYAKIIVKNILNYKQIMALDFVYSRDFCESDNIGLYKPLAKIYKHNASWKPEETIMLDNSPSVMRFNPRNGLVAPDYAEPHLVHDVYLYLLGDVFENNLPRNNIYPFVEKTNHVLPYLISAYNLDDPDDSWGVDRPQITKPVPKSINAQIAGPPSIRRV